MSLTESPLIIKIISTIITASLLSFILFVFFKTKWFKFIFWYDFVEFFTVKIYGSKKAARKWKKLMKKMRKLDIEQSVEYNHLIIKCDQILDFLLKHLVPLYQATDFTERLRRTGLATFRYPKLLWEAHTYTDVYLKNNRVILTKEQAQNMLNIYYHALKDLNII